jgi:nucleoid-associated protein YgaU
MARRKRIRWFLALAGLAGAVTIGVVSQWRSADSTPEPLPSAPIPAANLGPLPVALPEEPTRPAQLSGQIETAGIDDQTTAEPTSGSLSDTAEASCQPPPLGDDPWRPSARMASYQTSSNVKPKSSEANLRSAAVAPPRPSAVEFTSHRIVDGDTLSGLAQRYLGSSKRFSEIFDANRDRLPSPDLLPIGVELRIPVSNAVGSSPSPAGSASDCTGPR